MDDMKIISFTKALKSSSSGMYIFKIRLNIESLTIYMRRVLLCQNVSLWFPKHQHPQGISWGLKRGCPYAVGASQARNNKTKQTQCYLGLLNICPSLPWKEKGREKNFTFFFFCLIFILLCLFPYLYYAYQCKQIFFKGKLSSLSFRP